MTALDLPREPIEIPAHAEHGKTSSHPIEKQQLDSYAGVKTYLAWNSPGRPFRKRSRQFYLNGLLIMFLLLVVSFLFSQYLLMVVIVSLVFLSFVLNSVPPHDFHFRITSEGITIENHSFLWEELYDYYFKKQEGQDVIKVRTRAFLPGELTLTLGDLTKQHIQSVMLQFLPYRESIQPSFMEKAGEWLSKTFPLENLSSYE